VFSTSVVEGKRDKGKKKGLQESQVGGGSRAMAGSMNKLSFHD
jgi:hypothetical protein